MSGLDEQRMAFKRAEARRVQELMGESAGMVSREEFEARAAERDQLREELDSLYRLIVSYADLTHHVVHTNGDWRDIAKEWAGVVEKARAALAPGTPVDVE